MVGAVFHVATQKAVFLSVCNIQGIVSSSQFTSFNVKCKCGDVDISKNSLDSWTYFSLGMKTDSSVF